MKIFNPAIILVRPQLPENIGLVARAMHNCGLNNLILVSPREKWPNQKSTDSSANAKIIINKAKLYQSIDNALSQFNFVVATSSRKRFLQKPFMNNFTSLFKEISINKNIAFVFGPENSGLSNQELMLCDIIFSIPLSKKNKSLNISHSVLIMIYKWQEFFSHLENNNETINQLAAKKDFIVFMNFLEKELDKVGFFHPKEKKKSMLNNIQTMMLRAKLSKKEINTMWGMIKKLIK